MDETERVILVDEDDRPVGIAGKIAAHVNSALHRAFSIFLVDTHGRLLLQRRDLRKYHSGGLWANACCGHPRPGEPTLAAAHRRLFEELGLDAELEPVFTSRYRARVSPEMEENELVHVYFGALRRTPSPNPSEVMDVRVVSFGELNRSVERRDPALAPWLVHYVTHHPAEIAQGIDRVRHRDSGG